jgi:hypothetical protein
MNPLKIKGANRNPGAPANWDPKRDGNCGTLPVRCTQDEAGRVQKCESAWKPDAHELEMLNAGGHVVLRVIGWQVPVALYVEPASEAEPIDPPKAEAKPNG